MCSSAGMLEKCLWLAVGGFIPPNCLSSKYSPLLTNCTCMCKSVLSTAMLKLNSSYVHDSNKVATTTQLYVQQFLYSSKHSSSRYSAPIRILSLILNSLSALSIQSFEWFPTRSRIQLKSPILRIKGDLPPKGSDFLLTLLPRITPLSLF